MPDKKLTDAEIVKALGCISGEQIYCKECKYSAHLYYPECRQKAARDALDLINRLQAEIERLNKCRKEEVEKLMSATDKVILETKAEAYKEFAERLKEKYGYYDWENKTIVYPEDEIDDLLKELVGDNQ